jgi:hypothetical protein
MARKMSVRRAPKRFAAKKTAGTKADNDLREEKGEGDVGVWFGFFTERSHAKLGPRKWLEQRPPQRKKSAKNARDDNSLFLPGRGKAALAALPLEHWSDIRRMFAERLLRDRRVKRPMRPRDDDLPQSGVPGANNWVTIGPSVVRKGQATGNPPISGRVARLAIAPGEARVYAATAEGGVWRSDDAGASWKSTMDGFDVDPTVFATTSNGCGAIAIDPADPNRVYVGTGEGDVDELFGSRFLTSLPAYRGVGPIRSDDGGGTWNQEPTAAASPTLIGAAFFELAVDPGDRENVVAATNVGLYRREPDGGGGYHWVQKRVNKHTSVIVCRVGTTTTFCAAEHSVGVFSSPDGNTWTTVGAGFPTGAGRIALGARATDPGVLYAIVASGGAFLALSRLDGGSGPWRTVSGLPALGGQADYNLPIAVDPNNANIVYLAGSALGGDGSIFRCAITSSGSGPSLTYAMAGTFIGSGVHADVHALLHAPGDSAKLWTGCDGGVWRTEIATGAATFTHRNTGLATLCCNAFAQHPTQLAVLTVGLQDNGTARYTGEEVWRHVADGDGGTPIIDWADPNKVIVKINRNTFLATDGGQSTASFSAIAGGDASGQAPIFGVPLVTTPYNPGTPASGGIVAFGAGRNNFGMDLYISSTFGAAWTAPVATLPQRIFALAFASATRLYVGTTGGQVYRFDKSGAVWSQTRIDNVAAGALPLAGLVTDIEVDPADTTGASVYITFGGVGDQRHVWHFDGTQWQNRSGTGMAGLLDSSHNAIVADPANPTNIYVGADIGVWQSTNSGMAWAPMQNALPDAAVLDLQLHPTARMLRASTHGRGMFEYKIDPPAQPDVELYARDTALDVGRASTVDGLSDPETWPAQPVLHYLSRNIKVDVPTPAGYQTPTSAIDFLVFNDVIVDGSQATATMDPALGTVVNRVYVEVHNRGIVEATSARVMLLLANASMGLPNLPAGFEANVQSGTPIATGSWQTVGVQTLTRLRAGFPLVAAFNLPSTILPPPASLPGQSHHCLLALIHSAQDPFVSTQTNTDALAIAERKVAQRNLELVTFVGTPPSPGASEAVWSRIDLYGPSERERSIEIVIDARSFQGRLGVLLPPELKIREIAGLRRTKEPLVENWTEKQSDNLRLMIKNGRFSNYGCQQMLQDIRRVAEMPLLIAKIKGQTHVLSGLALEPGKRYPLFLYLEPEGLKIGQTQTVHVVRRDAKSHCVEGGSTYRIVVTPKSGKQDPQQWRSPRRRARPAA